jgi:hypothetical protein
MKIDQTSDIILTPERVKQIYEDWEKRKQKSPIEQIFFDRINEYNKQPLYIGRCDHYIVVGNYILHIEWHDGWRYHLYKADEVLPAMNIETEEAISE